ncbi:MAG TPA: PTS system mannose/fructose/sorbose family transporter subunit IID [Haloplasmataceae bacterium]
MAEVKVSKKSLRKAFWIWFFWHGCSQQAESMLGISFAHTMSPVINELYGDSKEETSAALKRHLTLFNTEQQVGSICPGIAIAMEQERANGRVNDQTIEAVKVALIGPTSAIGDSLWVATIIPILLTLAMAITRSAGSLGWMGPLLYMIAYPVGTLILSNYLFKLGYRSGLEGISKFMASGKLDQITQAVSILGLIVVGALTASFVSITLPIQIRSIEGGNVLVDFNTLINSIFPNLLPLLLTLFVYYLYGKKKVSPMAIMGIIFVLAVIFTGLGYLFGVY